PAALPPSRAGRTCRASARIPRERVRLRAAPFGGGRGARAAAARLVVARRGPLLRRRALGGRGRLPLLGCRARLVLLSLGRVGTVLLPRLDAIGALLRRVLAPIGPLFGQILAMIHPVFPRVFAVVVVVVP